MNLFVMEMPQIFHDPESPCILANSFCIPEELGDGIGQDHNNGPYCDMDSGDCCLPDADDTQCCLCSCREFQYWV